MVLSIKEFDEQNSQSAVSDFIADLENKIDQKMMKYAKADGKTRAKIERQNRHIANAYSIDDDKKSYVVVLTEGTCGKQKPNSPACLCETVPNEIGKKMMKFTEDQQNFIRETIEQDYKEQGWQTWGITRSLKANQIDEYYTYILTICCDKLATTFDLKIE